MSMATLLLWSILLPLVGALLVWPAAALGKGGPRAAALLCSLIALVLSGVVVWGFFQPWETPAISTPGRFAEMSVPWLGADYADIRFSISLDGISLWLYALSALLLVVSVLVSWNAIGEQQPLYYSMLLLLGGGCLGVFAAQDLILFYVFFEATLVPLFFLIGIWGSEQRRYAAAKFFVFTLTGSLLTFLGLLTIVFWAAGYLGAAGAWSDARSAPTRGERPARLIFDIPALQFHLENQYERKLEAAEQPGRDGRSLCEEDLRRMDFPLQMSIFLALFIGFAIKVPLFPLHTWLPLAHVQAPTAGSVFLAGILLKIGTYGFLRFNIPMLPDATAAAMGWLLWLSVAGIIYGALVALAQSDMKKLIAYSSVSHLGFCMLGMFALNPLGLQGSVLQMVNHGISTGALFAIVGMLYERYHTRQIKDLGGLARRMPVLAFFMLLFTMSSIGLPGLNGFVGEFLILLGMFQRGWSDPPAELAGQLRVVSVVAVAGVVLGAWYMLWLVQRVFFGPLREPKHHSGPEAETVRDLSPREIAALTPLAVLVVLIGVWPAPFLQTLEQPLQHSTARAREIVEHRLHTATPLTNHHSPLTNGN